MTLFAKQPNNENNMFTVGSRVKAALGPWHPNFERFPSTMFKTGTVLRAVGKGMWDVAFDDGYHDPSLCFSSKSLVLVPDDNSLNQPYGKRQKTVSMNLPSQSANRFFKTTPVTSQKHISYDMPTPSPFANITNELNNFITPNLKPTTSNNNGQSI